MMCIIANPVLLYAPPPRDGLMITQYMASWRVAASRLVWAKAKSTGSVYIQIRLIFGNDSQRLCQVPNFSN